MSRNSVDLPEPERPSRPTISPGRSVRLTFSSTTSSSPSGLRKDLQTPRVSRSGARFSASALAFMEALVSMSGSADAEFAFRACIERPPEEAIQHDHESRHDGDAEHRAREIPGAGGIGNVGAESGGGEMP